MSVSKMTYTVSNGTLNPSIPYHFAAWLTFVGIGSGRDRDGLCKDRDEMCGGPVWMVMNHETSANLFNKLH